MSRRSGFRGRALYRALLRVLPPGFVRRWGHDMELMLEDRLAEATGLRSRVAIWVRALADLAKHGTAERTRRGRTSHDPDVGDARGALLEPWFLDARTGLRALLRNPGFAAVAVGTLALGIGANTAIFSVVHSVLLAPLPYPEPDRLVRVWPETNFNKAMVERVEADAPALSAVAGISGWLFTLIGEGEPTQVSGALVSPSFFHLFGAEASLGRTFLPDEALAGRSDVVVLSHGIWHSVFGGDPEVIGRRIRLSGGDHDARTVVGVMPRGFRPVDESHRVWVPLERVPSLSVSQDDSWYVNVVVGRLGAGADPARAGEQVRRTARALHEEMPSRFDERAAEDVSVVPLRDSLVGDSRRTLWVLFGAVAVVLLVACTNVANLLLARARVRARDLAVRSALGAGRGRLFGQLLVESSVLGLAGGAVALPVAWLALEGLTAWAPDGFPSLEAVGIDPVVLGFTAFASVAATLVFGTAPAARAARSDPRASLGAAGGRGSVGVDRGRMGRGLVAAEVALSLVLLVGASLMLRSLWMLHRSDPGFDADGVLTMRLAVSEADYAEPDARRAFWRGVLERAEAVPGVRSAGAIHILPMAGGNWSFPYHAEDNLVPEGSPAPLANFRSVSPSYFETLGIPLLRGRPLGPGDGEDDVPVGLVNETLARLLWPDQDPVGKTIRLFSRTATPFTVVGVVGDVHQHGVHRDPLPELYRPFTQWPVAGSWVVVKTDRAPLSVADAVRDAVWAVDPDVPAWMIRPMDQVFGASVARDRFVALSISVFAGLALVLGLVGVYGVTSYTVSRRRSEFGIRIALGASPGTVRREALSSGVRAVGTGVVLGVVAAWASSGLISSLLFGVTAKDPLAFLAAPALLGLAGAMAAYLPAVRASRVDPAEVLRDD